MAINIITSNRPILDLRCCCNYHQKYTWSEFVLKVYTIFCSIGSFNLFPLITLKIGSIVRATSSIHIFFSILCIKKRNTEKKPKMIFILKPNNLLLKSKKIYISKSTLQSSKGCIMLKKKILNKKEEIYKRNKTCQKLYSDIQISCFYIFCK